MNTPSTSLVIIVRNCSQTMATIRGQHLFHSELLIVWRLFEGGGYSRAAAIRGRWLFEGGGYSRAAAIRKTQYLTYFCNLLHDIQCNHGYISIPHGPRVVHTPVESVDPRGLILDWTEIWVRRYSVVCAVHIL